VLTALSFRQAWLQDRAAFRSVGSLILPVRSLKKGEKFAQQLHKDVPSFRGDIKLLELDLNRFATIQKLVHELETTVDRLDIAILNAGCIRNKYTLTPDGYEETTQVNVLATGLLAVLLLPLLGKTAKLPKPADAVPASRKPQLEIVSSEGKPCWLETLRSGCP
jgi:retinol dehydrogenase-12